MICHMDDVVRGDLMILYCDNSRYFLQIHHQRTPHLYNKESSVTSNITYKCNLRVYMLTYVQVIHLTKT